MKVLIIGAGKTGTTALTYAIQKQLSNHEIIFEPSNLNKVSFSKENFIVKSVRIRKWRQYTNELAKFDKTIALVRHPYDRLISYLLYRPYNGEGFTNDILAHQYVQLLKEKQKNPQKIGVLEIADCLKKVTGNDIISEFRKEYNRILEFQSAGIGNVFFMKYEDFVDSNFNSLSDYMGFGIDQEFQVAPKYQRVTRTKNHGDWLSWFTKDDIEKTHMFFSDVFNKFNYAFTKENNDSMVVDPEHSYLYTIKVINEYRHKYDLPLFREKHLVIREEGNLIDKAISYLNKKDFSKAANTLTEVIKMNPNIPGTYLLLFRSWLLQKRFDEAAMAVLRAIEIAPDSAPAYRCLEKLLKERNIFQKAKVPNSILA